MVLASLNLKEIMHGMPFYGVWKTFISMNVLSVSDSENELTFIRFLRTYGALESANL